MPRRYYLDCCLGWLAVVVVAAVVALSIASLAVQRNYITHRRYSVNIDQDEKQANPSAQALGMLTLIQADGEVRWSLRLSNTSEVTALHVNGPVDTVSQVAPLLFSLCGLPSAVTCVSEALPGNVTLLEGSLFEVSDVGSMMPAQPPEPFIQQIADIPPLYSLQIRTTSFPDGAMTQQLDSAV